MILRILFILSLGLGAAAAWSQPNCVGEKACASQLIRVEISNSILQNNASGLLPVLQDFARSETLPSLIEKDYPLQPVSFPQNLESCLREKRGENPLFENIDCSEKGLCGKEGLDPAARELMCFRLPCPVFEGTLHAGACGETLNVYPNQLTFPAPISVDKIRLEPTKIEFKDKRAEICFKINELELSTSFRLGLDTRNTRLPDSGIAVENVKPRLDGPREICLSAEVDLTSERPVKNLTVTPQGTGPFVSDQMIREVSQNLRITGLSGYPEEELRAVQAELVPVIVQPVRDTVETAVRTSLASLFEQKLNQFAASSNGTSSQLLSSQNLASELGYSNLLMRNQLAITECAALAGAHRPIPPAHACMGLDYWGKPIDQNFDGPLINELMRLEEITRNIQPTSESMKQRLIALKDLVRAQVDEFARPDDPPHFTEAYRKAREEDITRYLDPLIEKISQNQLEGQILNFVEIQNQLQDGFGRNVGVSVPEICSDTHPSPHARREIPNCPVQAYVDLNEMNKVVDEMWKAGRLCQEGKGPYVPALEHGAQKYDPDGKPIGSGCYFNFSGMSCYLNAPPQITYDQRSRKYKTAVKLKACYRGPVLFGQGRIGGDFDISFNFTPKACNGGDFCMDNPDVDWKVVPGSERFALRPSSFFRGMVDEKIQSAINGAIGDTIRLPLTSGVGPLANIPLEAEGRVDTGPGFFGACLKLRTPGVSGQ